MRSDGCLIFWTSWRGVNSIPGFAPFARRGAGDVGWIRIGVLRRAPLSARRSPGS